MKTMKSIVRLLSPRQQHSLKRIYYSWRIRGKSFRSPEPEFAALDRLVFEGDCVVDIGANVGHYALAFSTIVGPRGHVFAFEPIPETFGFLAANCGHSPYQNVTLFNMAVSDRSAMLSMEVPAEGNEPNYYTARLCERVGGKQTFACSIDSIAIPQRVALVKIDVEGHEMSVLRGMTGLIARDHPKLIVEASSPEIINFLSAYGYSHDHLAGSPNYLFR